MYMYITYIITHITYNDYDCYRPRGPATRAGDLGGPGDLGRGGGKYM